MAIEDKPAPRPIDARVITLEIEMEFIKRQLALYEAAFMRMGQFVETVGKAAVEANKLPDQ